MIESLRSIHFNKSEICNPHPTTKYQKTDLIEFGSRNAEVGKKRG
jgi:hypothetical protein